MTLMLIESGDIALNLGCGGILILGLIIWIANVGNKQKEEKARRDSLTPDQRSSEDYGPLNLSMICPHCQTKGRIRTKPIERKAGISGGKATAAVLTAGLSLPATGLSRTEGVTQAHCEECNNTWSF